MKETFTDVVFTFSSGSFKESVCWYYAYDIFPNNAC